MIGLIEAAAQVERLQDTGLNYPPNDARELIKAVATADTPQIAESAVSLWIESQPNFPTPSQIKQIISEKNLEHRERIASENKPHHNCTECQDGGMRGGKLAGRAAGPWEFCSCQAGERLRAEDPQAVEESNLIREKLLGMAKTQAVA